MPTMDIHRLLARFNLLSNTYMRDEIEAAMQLQEEITPYLLDIIETVAANPLVYALEGHNGHVYAAALLAHFQEPAAHLPLIRAFSITEEQLVELWGDTTTETLPTMLYRTCNGSMAAIKDLIVNRDVDQYVRCAAMEALSYIVASDPSKRDEAVLFLQGQFTGEEADRESYFWGNLAATLCDIHPGESMEIIRKAYAENIVPTSFIDLESVEEANARDKEATMESLQVWANSRMPSDIHGYISWYSEFQKEEYSQPTPPASTGKNSSAGKKKKSGANKKNSGKKKRK